MSALELTIVPPTLQVMPKSDPREMTVTEAVDRFISMRLHEGIVKPKSDHWRHYDKQLRRSFCNALGTMPLKAVRPDHIRTWMTNIKHTRYGSELAPWTRMHYLKAVRTLMKRAVAESWIDKDPCAPVVSPRIPYKDVNVIAVKDAFHFFKVNVAQPGIARVALEAFGGLRFSTAGQIQKEAIDLDRRGITMAASIHKSSRRVHREGHPACLWEWLREAGDATWSMEWRAFREAKQLMHFRAGLRKEFNRYQCLDPEERERHKALRNVWRHSFVSYKVVLDGSLHTAAYLAQHTTTKTTAAHYEGMATKDDAKLYFAITPDAVRTMDWDLFRRWVLKPLPVLEPESVTRYAVDVQRAPARQAVQAPREDWRAG